MKRIVLMLMLMAVVGCRTWEIDHHYAAKQANLEAQIQWEQDSAAIINGALPRPDYVTRDSFIVRWDTTGCERVTVSCDTLWASYYPNADSFVVKSVATGNHEYRWQFTTKPIYMPKIVVQLTPDEHKRLMKILTAENGQHEN